ncbi:hypothetical protein GUITHDRAFT_148241 [Guillardia theta CCMP2712]|uniref:Uncharacterized protein n=1 Tax=Guillardia theta (strain CCMP2712) TaxID=905079 RepID=L1IAQ2_GUITC|nr:hypothetical protein GUITHDRAFT_148241 [Guillardia theta CCMP2712]EKX32999.1 hypothetical protein GUITHDRAFT_148241 [Guillardia theta CCMP2712]|eukprot:XP_005819979.1 hypothetical protein GUITHDRAFT_148241 [Guillardia theta CCMP2712]
MFEKEMRTQTSISAKDLVSFRVQRDIKVCFAVRELKDIVAFCNKTCLNMALKYQNDARCLIFTADKEDLSMTIDFVIAASDLEEDLDATTDSSSRGASQVAPLAHSSRSNFANIQHQREPLLTNDSIVSAATSESVLSHRDPEDDETVSSHHDPERMGVVGGSVTNGTGRAANLALGVEP